jgi:solute carrier family 39 (zinc transporter), member 7
MEKTLRVLGGDDGEHGHSHSHSHEPITDSASSTALSNSNSDGLRSRSERSKSPDANDHAKAVTEGEKPKGPSKLSAYLNLFGDFVHNM